MIFTVVMYELEMCITPEGGNKEVSKQQQQKCERISYDGFLRINYSKNLSPSPHF